jgi:dihydrofolate reductase
VAGIFLSLLNSPSHPFKAIVAMSLNRVIGRENKLPWHIPDELRWFKKMTTGQVIIMGRRTWESIGRPLPNRENIVVTRSSIPGIRTVADLSLINSAGDQRDFFIIGGAQLFREGLALCSDIYLTVVKRIVEGDVFLQPFEHEFPQPELLQEQDDFKILHFRRPPGQPIRQVSSR